MTPEKQRIVIAEACPTAAYQDEEGEWRLRRSRRQRFDPLNDLNAMHEVEKTLKTGASINEDTEARNYRCNLRAICGFDGAYTATAAQRAEAFLDVLKKRRGA
jgi:hypothetical protein